jgi:penicillin G amidase
METTIEAAAVLAGLRQNVPPASATLSAPVSGRVEVLRDRAGVPHVYASSTTDVYFGLGFAMAQDRLWQMDRLRRRALGRQAEILGAAYVESDLMHHAVGIPEIAASEVERTDEPTRSILESFVAGINRQIEARGRALPIEFGLLEYEPEPFTVRDTIAILRAEWWSLNGRLSTLAIGEAASLLPEHLRAAFLEPEAPEIRILPPGSPYPVGDPSLQPPGDIRVGTADGTGSNNWAVAGSHTASGHALLCGDPHQAFWLPSSWYEYALHGPDDDVAGAGHPGVPGLWWGFNGDIAWALTNNAASARDLYREEVHPTDPGLYRDGASWRAFDERTVEVRVRGADASVRHTQRATVRGPIVNHVVPAVAAGGLPRGAERNVGDPPLALRWVGQEHLDDVRAAIGIGRARDWETFRTALRDWSVAVFNFVYADRSGRVGYQCAGRVPIRGRVVRGYRDANEPADQWRGHIPFEALPHVVDPPRGYVASANERAAPDDYPYPLYGSWGGGHRSERIRQTLDGSRQSDRNQSVALQNDVKSCRAERLCPPLIGWLAEASDPDVVELRAALSTWDYCYTRDSLAPTVFETFMEVWQERVARERFPAELVPLVRGQGGPGARLIDRGDPVAWFGGDLRPELEAAARAAMELVRARHGSDPAGWEWGCVHQAHWRHPLSTPAREWLDIGPAPVDGGADTVRNTGAGQPAFTASSGAEYRMVVDFAEPDRFLAVQNIGNSGEPGSPHYADQFPAWLAGEYHVVALHRPDVERDLEGLTILYPT